MAVEDLDGIVVRLVADQRPHENELVHHSRQARERFADLNTGDVGGDRAPRAGDLLGGVRFQIEHVLMRRTSDQVNQNNGLARRANAGGRLRFQEPRQSESR